MTYYYEIGLKKTRDGIKVEYFNEGNPIDEQLADGPVSHQGEVLLEDLKGLMEKLNVDRRLDLTLEIDRR